MKAIRTACMNIHTRHIWIVSIVAAALISCAHGIMSEAEPLEQDLYLCRGSFPAPRSQDQVRETVQKVTSELEAGTQPQQIDILSPYDGAVFPRDIASPVFKWEHGPEGVTAWLILVSFEGSSHSVHVLTNTPEWTPQREIWEIIKIQSLERQARVTVTGIHEGPGLAVLSKGLIHISISKDGVESPVLYQHMPLPFATGKQNPKLSVWRLAQVSSYEEPPVIMKNLPVCGNCHCISQKGTLFGMDMDINGDKGAYTVAKIEEEMKLAQDDFVSWNDFNRSDKIQSMGLFSRISPDDRYIVSTVKETSFFSMIPDINFSQFFFPIQGIIAWYSFEEKQFHELPGADDPDYVQTCPEWSHDGRYVLFARARTDKRLDDIIGDRGYFNIEPGERIHDLNKKYQIQFDLYRVAFNKGKGGTPEPVIGASNNGMSNYFPRCSPDGRWIVFTRSPTGLAIQPESRLVIIPAEGGIPREMTCNLNIMNSWHSWSANSRWLVFSSKEHSPFTGLFLTHIDENGTDSPPVALSRFSSPSLACLAPELVNIEPGAIKKILLPEDTASWERIKGPQNADSNAR